MKQRNILLLICLVMLAGLVGCGNKQQADADTEGVNSYVCISQEEAANLMETEEDYIILDVRTIEEFAVGHIEGAICIPNETISEEEIAELPDKEQLILVYCRSGNRSKQASEKLAAMGYTNIKEFGGINTWEGTIVTE